MKFTADTYHVKYHLDKSSIKNSYQEAVDYLAMIHSLSGDQTVTLRETGELHTKEFSLSITKYNKE